MVSRKPLTLVNGQIAQIPDGDTLSGLAASNVAVTPTGAVAATDVQGAIAELDAEKQPVDATLTALSGRGIGAAAGTDILDRAAGDARYATAAQGAKADTAVQPSSLATVATSGAYGDLTGKPSLGTAAAQDSTAFATAAQGAKADTAVQPASLAIVATTGVYSDLTGKPANATGTVAGLMSATDKTKLDGVATGATANATDAQLRDRSTHTGSQAISTVTGLQTALDAKAPLASPAFTGTPTAVTPTSTDNSTALATTAFVKTAISSLVNAAPTTLDTLNELASALGNDPNFATTIAGQIGAKQDAISGAQNTVYLRTAAGTGALSATSAPMLGVITAADAATARTTLGLSSLSTQAASSVAITGGAINGVAIGATTASTGAFTTITGTLASGGQLLGLSSTGNTPYLRVNDGTYAVNFGVDSTNPTGGSAFITTTNGLRILTGSGSYTAAQFTSTGLNACAIGATTPSTGAFTTLSASGTADFSGALYAGAASSLPRPMLKAITTTPYYGSALYLPNDQGTQQGGYRLVGRYHSAVGSVTNLVFERSSATQAYGADPSSLSYSEVARFDATGNFGIGTQSPAAKVHIDGGGSSAALRIGSASFTSNYTELKVDTTNSQVSLSSSSAWPLAFWANGAEQVRVTGTASATRYVTLTGATGPGRPTLGTSAGDLMFAPGSGNLVVCNMNVGSSASAYTIGSDPGYAAGGRIELWGSTSPAPNTVSIKANNVGVYSADGGTQYAYINSTGIGIGGITASTKLDVYAVLNDANAYQAQLRNYQNGVGAAALAFNVSGASETVVPKAAISFQRAYSQGRGILRLVNNIANDTNAFTTSDAVWEHDCNNGSGDFHRFLTGGTARVYITATGFQGAIGASTPNMGAFTTITATGDTGAGWVATITSSNATNNGRVLLGSRAASAGAVQGATNAGAVSTLALNPDGGQVTVGAGGLAVAGGASCTTLSTTGSTTVGNGGSSTLFSNSGNNWNYGQIVAIRSASNTASTKMLSLMLGGDAHADTTLANYWNFVLNTTTAPVASSTSVGLSANLSIVGPGYLSLAPGGGEQVRIVNTASAARYLTLTGATSTGSPTISTSAGDLTIGSATGAVNIASKAAFSSAASANFIWASVSRPAGQVGYQDLQTGGSTRWRWGIGNAAESGSNAGSDFFIQSHDDTGTYLALPFQIIRSTGRLKLGAYGAGTLVTDASGNVTASSDATLKDIVGDYTPGLAELQKLTPKVYRWNEASGLDTENEYAGFIAQDVESAGVELAVYGDDGHKTLTDRALVAALVNAVKQLASRIEMLEAA